MKVIKCDSTPIQHCTENTETYQIPKENTFRSFVCTNIKHIKTTVNKNN